MKKILVLCVVLFVMAGFTYADDIGITVGVEFGIDDVNDADAMAPYIMPNISYDTSFLDGALSLSTGLDYLIYLTDDNYMDLTFRLNLGYRISLSSASTLSLFLNNSNTIYISPEVDSDTENAFTGTLTPGVRYYQDFDFGGLYARLDFPIYYLQDDKDADLGMRLNCTLGWDSTFGLGLNYRARTALLPSGSSGYIDSRIIVSYEADSFYAELATTIPKDTDYGITLSPYFEYYFDAFTFYTGLGINGIGANGGDVGIDFYLGATFSF